MAVNIGRLFIYYHQGSSGDRCVGEYACRRRALSWSCSAVFLNMLDLNMPFVPSFDWSRICTLFPRGAAYRYIFWEQHGQFVLLFLVSSVQFHLSDTWGGYLGSRLGIRNATEVEMFTRRLTKYWAVNGTASKARTCICGNAGVLAWFGGSPLISLGYAVVLLLLLAVIELRLYIIDVSNARFGDVEVSSLFCW